MAVSAETEVLGEFSSVTVALRYDGSDCVRTSATQTVGASSIAVLVSFDRSGCRERGLSTRQKVAIGVACGVGGLVLLVMLVFCIIMQHSPHVAASCVLLTTHISVCVCVCV